MKLIYRNDDFNFGVELDYLKGFHAVFEKYKVDHTIALDFGGHRINPNPEILDYIRNSANWDIQFHCYEHTPYRDLDHSKIEENLEYMIAWTKENLKVTPTVYYPPWGRTGNGPVLEEAAKKFGISVETDCAFINYYCGAIAKGEEYFNTVKGESNHFIPYAKWDRVYFHLNTRDQAFLVPYLIKATADVSRGESETLDFNKKKDEIAELTEAVKRVEKGDFK